MNKDKRKNVLPQIDEGEDKKTDNEEWFHKDCKLCNELKANGGGMTWFPDEEIEPSERVVRKARKALKNKKRSVEIKNLDEFFNEIK